MPGLLDPLEVIGVSLAEGAATLGASDAAQIHRKRLESSFQVTANLNDQQIAQLKSMVEVPFIPKGGRNITSDHPVLYAAREIVRQAHEDLSKLAHTSLKTLIVGAAFREYSLYNFNPHIYYHFANKDSRDVSRTILPIIERTIKNIYTKLSKKDRLDLTKTLNEKRHIQDMLTRVQNLEQMQTLLKKVDPTIPHNIITDINNLNGNSFARLNFQDSIYNFSGSDLIDIFKKTGATEGYGYAFLPLEILFPDLPKNDHYSVRHIGENTYFNFRHGGCTGYVHKTENILTLFKDQVIKGENFSLVTHIESRMGPYVVFRIEKTLNAEEFTRVIELPKGSEYVRVLDIPEVVDMKTGTIRSPLRYFSVNRDEYLAVQNFSLAINPESVTVPALVTFIRNRIDGANLVNKQIVNKWSLQHDEIYKLAFAVYFEYCVIHKTEILTKENIGIGETLALLKRLISTAVSKLALVFAPIWAVYNILRKGNLINQIILQETGEIFQTSWSLQYDVNGKNTFDIPLQFSPMGNNDDLDCDFCQRFEKVKGAQEVICNFKQKSTHTFIITDEQIQNMFAMLADDDKDPAGLREIKKIAKENLPKTGFRHTVKTSLIEGPPGTGKSYTIRALAKQNHLVYAPFTKLLADYRNVVTKIANEDGTESEKIESLFFQTTHRAFRTRGNVAIWVDEFTSMDYYMVAVVSFLNGCDEVYFVGDEKQTRILPEEGTYIGDVVDFNKTTRHTLVYNFRNPRDVVAKLNRDYGYKMIPKSGITKSVFVDRNLDFATSGSQTMHFKEKTGKENGLTKNTIRMNQGGTHDQVNLLVTAYDGDLLKNPALNIVALSRHRERLNIVPDASDLANEYVISLGFDDKFYEDIDKFIPKLEDVLITEAKKPSMVELMDFLLELNDPGIDIDLLRATTSTKQCHLNIFTRTQNFSLFERVTGRCKVCFNQEKCYCDLLPVILRDFIYHYRSITLKAVKFLKNDDGKSPNLTKINSLRLMSLSMALFIMNQETKPNFEQFLLDSKLFESSDAAKATIDHYVSVKHPMLMSFLNINKKFQILKNKLEKNSKKHTDLKQYYENYITKVKGFKYNINVDVTMVINNYEHYKQNKSQINELSNMAQIYLNEENINLKDKLIKKKEEKPLNKNMANVHQQLLTILEVGKRPFKKIIKFLKDTTISLRERLSFANKLRIKYFSNILSLIKPKDGNKFKGILNDELASLQRQLEETDDVDTIESLTVMINDFKAFKRNNTRLMKMKSGMKNLKSKMLILLSDLKKSVSSQVKPIVECVIATCATIPDDEEEDDITDRLWRPEFIEDDTEEEDSQSSDSESDSTEDREETSSDDSDDDDNHDEDDSTNLQGETSLEEEGETSGDNPVNVKNHKESYTTVSSLASSDASSFVNNFPLPKNCCLLTTISKLLTIPVLTLWDVIVANTNENLLKDYDYEQFYFSAESSQILSDYYSVKFVFSTLDGSELVITSPEANHTYYIDQVVKDGSLHFSVSERNVFGAFVNASDYDVIVRPNRKIESVLNLDGSLDSHKRFEELFTFYSNGVYWPHHDYVIDQVVLDFDKPIQPRQHPAQDSFRLLRESLPTITLFDLQSLNRFAILNIPDQFTNGKYFPETMLNPVNPRFNPVTKQRKFYVLSSGYGLHYNQIDQFQELQCLQNRYLCKKANKKWENKAEKLANEIADLFTKEHFSGNYSVFDDTEVNKVLVEYAEACRKKHYPSQAVGLIENVRSRNVRFSMKNIFKPGKLKLDIEKAGQGISAWAKDIQIMIGGVIRILSRHVSLNLNPGIIYNNGLTDRQLVDTMNASFAKQHPLSDTAVIDFDCYDATQNRFTQQIERRLMKNLGISDDVIELYYSFRENYPLVTKILKANGGFTKTSGEPGTLLFNTLLAMALTNYICRGALAVVMMGQGDDVIKRCLSINRILAKERIALLQQYVSIKMKLEINQGLEFCGYVIVNGQLIPSLARKLKKISGHRFRDYKHFCEYQISIRDTIGFIKDLGVSRVIAENANMMKSTYEAAEQHYNMLESFGHINEAQFYEQFSPITVDVKIPTENILFK